MSLAGNRADRPAVCGPVRTQRQRASTGGARGSADHAEHARGVGAAADVPRVL